MQVNFNDNNITQISYVLKPEKLAVFQLLNGEIVDVNLYNQTNSEVENRITKEMLRKLNSSKDQILQRVELNKSVTTDEDLKNIKADSYETMNAMKKEDTEEFIR